MGNDLHSEAYFVKKTLRDEELRERLENYCTNQGFQICVIPFQATEIIAIFERTFDIAFGQRLANAHGART